ncbi:MATE family efflux transporter [Evtepia sp.]|uniref:MATE family efflux transporter n=1 Tax=Evtepia sp. TaxID=2773933 RepID=UPI00399B5679
MKRWASIPWTLALVGLLTTPALAAVEDTGFADVDRDSWYAGAVEYVRDSGIMLGTGEALFAPDQGMTRAMLATTLGNAANMVMVRLAAGYGDIPVAAYGIVKRIDQVPLNLSMGLCQGFMPLVGYNFAAGNYRRMRQVSVFSWKTALGMSACFVACFALFAPQILHLFLPEAQTSALGASFLRIACLAVPLTAVNFLISYTLQAMGKGAQSALLTFSRQGLLNIPLLLLMNWIFGLYGMIWTQLVVEVIMLPVSLGMYTRTFRALGPQTPQGR